MGIKSKEIPESRGLFVIIMLADMLNTIVREIIIVANGDRQASATAAITMFVLIALLFFGLMAITHFVYLCIFKHHYTTFIASGVQTIGAALYFYGDNISSILNNYGLELGCDRTCVTNNRIAASFSLGVALIIFQVVPPILHKMFKILKKNKKITHKKVPNWISAIDMITVLVKIDTLYSAIFIMVESTDFCSHTDIATTVSFIAICIIIGFIAEIVQYIYAYTTNQFNDKVFTCLISLGLVMLLICFPLYILADNHQPLDCAFGCDTFAANTTINDLSCNVFLNSGVRLSFTVISFISIAVFSLVYFVCNHTSRELDVTDYNEDIEMKKHPII